MRRYYEHSTKWAAISLLALLLVIGMNSCKSSSKQEKLETAPQATTVDWCPEHRVPESECTQCHPELAAKWKAQPGMWCEEHGIPEPHCYLCHPNIKFPQEALYLEQQKKLGVTPSSNETNNSEPKVRSDKPTTSLYRHNASDCATDQAVIQLAGVETAERAGMIVEMVQEAPATEAVEASGEVKFDSRSAYAVTSLVGGTLVQWLVQPGQSVKQGQTLAYLESIEGAQLKADYAHAAALLKSSRAAYEREQGLMRDNLTSQKELQEAEANFRRDQADYNKAAAALKALGFSDQTLAELEASDAAGASIPIRAKHSGVLVELRVDLGAVLQAGESIGLIAKPDQLWVEVQVRERDMPGIRVGQNAEFSVDGEAIQRTQGRVTWVADAVDPVTRMGRVRLEAESNGSRLRAHQFVRALIETGESENAILVPTDAVQWEGCCNIVFVAESLDRFKPRKVNVSYGFQGHYAVTGLMPGEKIVTRGSYMLKTELMKSSIGAGCCGVGA